MFCHCCHRRNATNSTKTGGGDGSGNSSNDNMSSIMPKSKSGAAAAATNSSSSSAPSLTHSHNATAGGLQCEVHVRSVGDSFRARLHTEAGSLAAALPLSTMPVAQHEEPISYAQENYKERSAPHGIDLKL